MDDGKIIVAKGATTITLAFLGAYFGLLYVPLIILALVMVLDWVTGVTRSYLNGKVSSEKGWRGIIKKTQHLAVVLVAIILDLVSQYALAQTGITSIGIGDYKIEVGKICFWALLVITWLIINELISILENLGESGVPFPKFLLNALTKLKAQTEKAGETKEDFNGTEEDSSDPKQLL